MTEPRFSHDGRRLLYASESNEHLGFRIRTLDGTGADVIASPPNLMTWESSWQADGLIAYSSSLQTGTGTADIWTLEPGASAPQPLLSGPDNLSFPSFSPAGDLLAYTSDRTGREEVYLTAFPVREAATPWQVSTAGGAEPRWSGDGTTLWFRDGDRVLAVEVRDGARTAEPVGAFDGIDSEWGIAADGSFVVTRDLRQSPHLRMVLNWFEDLKAKVPVGRE